MSNTRVNSLPDLNVAADVVVDDAEKSDAEEPEPEPPPGSKHFRDFDARHIEVDVLWDDSVAAWRERLGLSDDSVAAAARAAATLRGFDHGQIGVRITDDPTIHQINSKHLSHDYPTDVISFPYGDGDQTRMEGELVASVETAAQNAADVGWETTNELLLYVIHGVLHIAGMDDHDDDDRLQMRQAERDVLVRLGIDPEPTTNVSTAEGSKSEDSKTGVTTEEGIGRG